MLTSASPFCDNDCPPPPAEVALRARVRPNCKTVQPATRGSPGWHERQCRRAGEWALLVFCLMALCGCSTLSYYSQAIGGQFEIWRKQQPITEVMTQPGLSATLRSKLELVVAARAFAASHLGLPDGGSYHEYVELGREAVVWNVFAAPALSLAPLRSCYPIAGCLEYRGFFARQQAEAYAARLRAQHYDVFVGGVAAYSTLGWFKDPVLSTILAWDAEKIVEILFHELAHQRVYIAGDTTFNESYAMAVGEAGVRAWLTAQGRDDSAYQIAQNREQAFIALLLEARAELARLYGGPLPTADKQREKARALVTLRQRYATLKTGWDGDTRYDAWMAEDLNNAKLASISTYHDHVAAFLALLAHNGGDFPRFHAAVERLAALETTQRQACLAALAIPHDPTGTGLLRQCDSLHGY